ncbi:hypothetical protein ABZZ74_43225 [Streptomyces sp. NPDC006476]|uniref:hypothetical protein n=1 Tax=Streptomyces sp. NPDC006476 TaxID=3157175 RepID=UPI0033B7EF90
MTTPSVGAGQQQPEGNQSETPQDDPQGEERATRQSTVHFGIGKVGIHGAGLPLDTGLAGGDIQDLPSQAWWFRERFTK